MYAARRTVAMLVAGLALGVVWVSGSSAALATPRSWEAVSGRSTDSAAGTSVAQEDLQVPVGSEPDGTAVSLDTTVYRPASGSGPWPAVVLAHGFGGSKADLAERGRDLAERGFLVLGYSARGFGQSGGRIHLNDPAYEIADGRALVDLLATRADVRQDLAQNPRVGVVGASYGGALALMLAATDPKVDSVVAAVTWHDLAEAFFPQAARTPTANDGIGPNSTTSPTDAVAGPIRPDGAFADPVAVEPGPLTSLWLSRFFGSTLAGASGPGAPVCGRFDPVVCELFLDAAETGRPSPALLSVLREHSPRPLLTDLRASTLLVQGMADSIFGIEHADATARAIAGQVPRLGVRWIDGGHDGPSSTVEADEQALRDWLADTLTGPDAASSRGPASSTGSPAAAFPAGPPGFVYAAPIPRRRTVAPLLGTLAYPPTTSMVNVPLTGPPEARIVSPPGGQPASMTSIPAVSGLGAGLAAYQLAALPGQSVAFDTPAFAERTTVVGSPRVTLTVTSSGREVVLFGSLWQVTGGQASLPRRLVAPIRLLTVPGQPTTIDMSLPAATWTIEAGGALRLLLTSTDAGYAAPRAARVDSVAVHPAGLRLPRVEGTVVAAESEVDTESVGVAVAIAVVLAGVAVAVVATMRRRRRLADRPDLAPVPLAVEGLVKTFADGHRAVAGVSWRAERGQVVGLLGPNGAGKTTTLRMALGLITPDSGVVYLGGRPVFPGAPALAGVGALVEGPGFLPHLTGRQNLHAYWAATGRPTHEAHVDEALEVAALGNAVDRPVRAYSHGMRQRLGIAQAMLGLPDLLVLDEPTNGLDPPQIAAMRPILQQYAAAGRTVVVSSHLLGEVEQTCSHVVVMHAGRVVTAGPVADIVGATSTAHLEEAFLRAIAAAQTGAPLPGPADSTAENLRQVRAR